MEIKFNENLKKSVLRTLNEGYVADIDRARGEALYKAINITKGNLGAALRMLMMADQELFEEVAYLQSEHDGGDHLQKTYDRMAKPSEDGKTAFQRASAIDADAGAGDQDFATLFVEKTIKKRVEAESEILSYVDSKRMTAKSGKFPKSSNLAKCAFATTSADLTDLTNTVDVGFDNTAIEAEKFGGTMFLEAEVFVKLDAQVVDQILDELTIANSRGLRDQIYNGTGVAPNATGLATNATSVTFDGNVTQTLIKMIATVADVTKGGMKEIFIITNTAGMTTLLGEKFINQSYMDMIEVLAGKSFAKSFPIVEDNVIVTSGASPDKTAPLYVGKKGDYLYATQSDPQIMMDEYSDFKAGGKTARIMSFWHGKPHFNDSFAKTTIPSIY